MTKPKRTCSFPGCAETGEPPCENTTRSSSESLCGKHRMRVRKHGDPSVVMQIRGDDRRRLDSYIDHLAGPVPEHAPELGPCSPWTGSLDSWGYGVLRVKGTGGKATRVAWELLVGPIPDGQQVLHRCDNPPCVRLDHLWVGTQSDNMRDMYAKGRHARLKGYNNGNATLTDKEVREIRDRYEAGGVSQQALADEYEVSQSLVSLIILRQAWRHVP